MGKVTGLGGAFLKAKDPGALYTWYEKHLGIQREPHGSFAFPKTEIDNPAVLAFFPETTDHFGPGDKQAMLNLTVQDLDGLLGALAEAGVKVESGGSYDFGKFGYFTDPEGNRVEVWEPVA